VQLIKHAHACVSLVDDGGRIVIDPGVFTPDAAAAVAAADAVLVTHDHFDHLDEKLLTRALETRPDLRVYGPAGALARWSGRHGQAVPVTAGDRLTVAGFRITVLGELHASIHPDIPRVANVGYLVDERLLHPGDAYLAPDLPVDTLLLPTSGPWTSLAAAADYVRAVAPRTVVQIHEAMLSEIGQQSMSRFLDGLTGVPLTTVPAGTAITA
jgi:L-ascorbate metabolism protein UlaG (beta-lactamase superfamily)